LHYTPTYIRFEPYNVSDIEDLLDLNGLTLVILLRFYQLKIGLLMQFSVSNITNDNNCNAVEHFSACISHFEINLIIFMFTFVHNLKNDLI